TNASTSRTTTLAPITAAGSSSRSGVASQPKETAATTPRRASTLTETASPTRVSWGAGATGNAPTKTAKSATPNAIVVERRLGGTRKRISHAAARTKGRSKGQSEVGGGERGAAAPSPAVAGTGGSRRSSKGTSEGPRTLSRGEERAGRAARGVVQRGPRDA